MATKYKEIINKFNHLVVESQTERVAEILDVLARDSIMLGWRILSIEGMEFALDQGSLNAKITCIFKHPDHPEHGEIYTRGTIRIHSVHGNSPVWDEIVSQDVLEDYDE